MALNYLLIGFFVVAFVVAYFRSILYGQSEVWSEMVGATFDMAELSVSICLGLIGVMAFWLGIMKVGEKAGAINAMARLVSPLFTRLFPELPKNHPAMGSMVMNFSANMLGLDNAATPLGLKAMHDLQSENKNKEVATNAQIMFLVLNTSGLTLIPVSVMALRATSMADQGIEGSPTDIFLPILVATYFSSLVGLLVVGIKQRLKLHDPVVLAYLLTMTALIGGILWALYGMPPEKVSAIAESSGTFLIFMIILMFLLLGMIRKVNVYEAFIEGAKEGFKVAIKIIPYLIAMLVGIGVFRASGSLDFIIGAFESALIFLGASTEFVTALPVAFMKPLSGSGARAMMVDVWNTQGVTSFPGSVAAVMQGSTETTFYTLAVYFGAVGVKNTRYTLWAGLIADLAGIIAAILVSYLFFGDRLA